MKISRATHLFIMAFLLAALLPFQAPVRAQSSGPEISADDQFVPGELIVGFEPGQPTAQMDARASALAGSVSAQVAKTYDDMALLSLDPAADLDAAAEQLRSQVGVQYVERNYIRRVPAIVRGDSYQLTSIERKFSTGGSMQLTVERLKAMRSQVKVNGSVRTIPTYPSNEWTNWGSSRIGHDIIWPEKSASPWVCVADTGVDGRHPDLAGRVVNGYDFINADSVPNDDYGHGTHVAGIIVGKLNSKKGPAGISNGKVLAVKVLGAQGWGTDFDVASGIRYCANNSYVKVINLSLGGSAPSITTFSALDYAINTKGKLVVAAAGNGSTSVPEYPAAWASPTIDGLDSLGSPTPGVNTVAQGMLSVGAAIPTDYYAAFGEKWGPTWVDLNGNNTRDPGEDTFAECAANFSNYGKWVEVVAPGDAIWSTLPVSYPFYTNYFFDDGTETPGYAEWGGTSMAAAHVSAAVARLWSIKRNLNNAAIHDLLIDTGDPLNLAVDPNMTDATTGFNATGYPEEAGAAPFCWPDATGPYGADQDMSGSRYINLAVAMDRGILSTLAYDSVAGIPLQGAKIQAQDANTGAIKDTAIVSPPMENAWADLINLPATHVYHLRIYKPGYTYGYQYYGFSMSVLPGKLIWDPWLGVAAVPPMRSSISVVAQWWHADDPFEDYGGTGAGDIDLYLWLPDGKNTIIGPEKYSTDPTNGYFDINPYSVAGTLVAAPYARYQRDGGWGPRKSGGLDWVNIETIDIKNRLMNAYYPGEYKIFMTNNKGTAQELNDAYPLLTIWRRGRIIGWSFQAYTEKDEYSTSDPGYCNSGENWWYGGSISGSRFYLPDTGDECGTKDILPYWIPAP